MCESSFSFCHGSTHTHQSFDQNRDTNCHAEIGLSHTHLEISLSAACICISMDLFFSLEKYSHWLISFY
jgi:hypothetical protein